MCLISRRLHTLLVVGLVLVNVGTSARLKENGDHLLADADDGTDDATGHVNVVRKNGGPEVSERNFIQRHWFTWKLVNEEATNRYSEPSSVEPLDGNLVLTDRELLAFVPSSRCGASDFNFDGCSWGAADASMDVATIKVESQDLCRVEVCLVSTIEVSGCETANCKTGRVTWKLYSPDSAIVLRNWIEALDKAYLERNQIQEHLAPSIARAIEDVRRKKDELQEADQMPSAFSPFLGPFSTAKTHWLAALHQTDYDNTLTEIQRAFEVGAIPYLPGKNSRSGASFFFSQDKTYIAKRVRTYELEALWAISHRRQYEERFRKRKSLLNRIDLAFVSASDNWIIMRTEKLPNDAEMLLKDVLGKAPFFEDLKPEPLVSDRVKFSQYLLKEHAVGGLTPRDLRGWAETQNNIHDDANFLDQEGLVDYSLLMHGMSFDWPKKSSGMHGSLTNDFDWFTRMTVAVSNGNGCSFNCEGASDGAWLGEGPSASDVHLVKWSTHVSRQLVDATDHMDKANGGKGRLILEGATYKCCCVEMKLGDSLTTKSPCVLVNVKKRQKNSLMGREGCGNLMQPGAWHNYEKSDSGKCMLGFGIYPDEWATYGKQTVTWARHRPDLWVPSAWDQTRWEEFTLHPTGDRLVPTYVGPEVAFGMAAPQARTPRCMIMCVSVLDYLLPLNAWNKFENVLLLPVYGGFKWGWYRDKIVDFLSCLGKMPLLTNSLQSKMQKWQPLGAVLDNFFMKGTPASGCSDITKNALSVELDSEIIQRLTVDPTSASGFSFQLHGY